MSAGGRLGIIGGARLADGASEDPYGLNALTTGILMATVTSGVATVSTVTIGVGLTFASGSLKNNLVDGTTDTAPGAGTSGMHWNTGGATGDMRVVTNGTIRLRVVETLAGVGVTGSFFVNTITAGGIAGGSGVVNISGNGGASVIKVDTNKLAYFNGTAVAQQAVAALTNSITAGGVNDTLTNWTDLAVYGNDAAAIRNAVYQCGRKLDQILTALRGTSGYNLFS